MFLTRAAPSVTHPIEMCFPFGLWAVLCVSTPPAYLLKNWKAKKDNLKFLFDSFKADCSVMFSSNHTGFDFKSFYSFFSISFKYSSVVLRLHCSAKYMYKTFNVIVIE